MIHNAIGSSGNYSCHPPGTIDGQTMLSPSTKHRISKGRLLPAGLALILSISLAGCAAGTPAPSLTEPPGGLPAPHVNLTSAPMFKLANCAGVRIFSNWAPQTLPWGFDEPWASRATQTAHVFFVAVQCDKADVGGVSSFQNVSFVWELHTNLSAGPELEGRSWLELSATTSLHAGPADFQQALADIGVAAQLATVDSTPTGDAVRVDGDAGQIAISYETKSPYIPGPVLSPEDLISILDIEPLVLLSGTVAFAAPYDVAWPTIIANGSFAITALEDYWPAPIYWRGGPIERASYEFEVERFP